MPHYVRPNESNLFQVGGNSETVVLGNIEDRAPTYVLRHDEALNLSAWLLATVHLQSEDPASEMAKFRMLTNEARGHRVFDPPPDLIDCDYDG